MLYGQQLMHFNPQLTCMIPWEKSNSRKDLIHNVDECGVILFSPNMEELLVVLQSSSGKWGFPKGHMTAAEMNAKSYFSCAKRELMEETNIDLRLKKHTKYGTLIIGNKLFYIVELRQNNVYANPKDRNEIKMIKWIPRVDLYNFVKMNQCNVTLKRLF
jgi:8-oxo-dGTP pyrophosphatase MutT (NUDIX family)